MSHTPGPWDVDDDTMEIFSITPGHSTGWIAKVLGNDNNGRPLPPEEMAANARLIAAAPDLLDTLRLADDALDYAQAQVDSESDRERLRHWRTRVQNVIALAEGR